MDYTRSGILIQDELSKGSNSTPNVNIREIFGHLILSPIFSQLYMSNETSGENYEYENESIISENRTEESEYVPYIDRPETYIVPVLFLIIFIIGILGNGTLILIFLKHRTMRNVPNMYICSLAVGDILVILFVVPFTSTVYTVESWPYGLIVCKFSEFIKDVSIGVSVFTLTALSADRYFAIVDPMRKLAGCRATRVTSLSITGIWILSILIALPSALFSYVRVIDDDPKHTFQVCYPFPPEFTPLYPKIVVLFKFLVYYAIPLLFIGTFYIIMAQHLVLSTKNMPGEAQQGQGKQIQARKKVAKMVLSFVVIFALCFFPSHVFLLWFYFDPESEKHFNSFWNSLRIVGFCLGFINSCINPITLYCLSGTFRKYFNRHLFCCGKNDEVSRTRHRNLVACGAACGSMSNSGHPAYIGGPVFTEYRMRNGNMRNRPLNNQQNTQLIPLKNLNPSNLSILPSPHHAKITPQITTHLSNFPLTSISLTPAAIEHNLEEELNISLIEIKNGERVEGVRVKIEEEEETMTSFINNGLGKVEN